MDTRDAYFGVVVPIEGDEEVVAVAGVSHRPHEERGHLAAGHTCIGQNLLLSGLQPLVTPAAASPLMSVSKME